MTKTPLSQSALIAHLIGERNRLVKLVRTLTPEQAGELYLVDGVPYWEGTPLGERVPCDCCQHEWPWSPATGWQREDGTTICPECAAPDVEGVDRMRRTMGSAYLTTALHMLIRARGWLDPGLCSAVTFDSWEDALRAERDLLLAADSRNPDSWHAAERNVRQRVRDEVPRAQGVDTQHV